MGLTLHTPTRSFDLGYGHFKYFRNNVAEKYFEGHNDLIKIYKTPTMLYKGDLAKDTAKLMFEYGYANKVSDDGKHWQNLVGSKEAGMDFLLYEIDCKGKIPYSYADVIIPYIQQINDCIVGYISDKRNLKTEFISMLEECRDAKKDLYWN